MYIIITVYTRLTILGILLHTKIFHKCIYSGTFNSELCNEQHHAMDIIHQCIKVILLLYTWHTPVTLSYFRHQCVYFVRLYYWSTVHYLTPGVHHTMCVCCWSIPCVFLMMSYHSMQCIDTMYTICIPNVFLIT